MSGALQPGRIERLLRSGVILYLFLLVILPLTAIVVTGFGEGLEEFWSQISQPIAREAVWLTLWTAGLVALINTVLGTATAWILVRHRFPLRGLVSSLVDLPLAIPTLVTGLMIAILYGPGSLIGESFRAMGVELVFAKPGIILALLFVTLPFVIRAVAPLLEELDPAEEEAAVVLGAGPIRTFRAVFFPVIFPAALSSGARSLGRAIGEFGSIVIVAGNIPFETLTAPIHIFGAIESGMPHSAAAISVLLLVVALALHGTAGLIEKRVGARHAER